MNPNPSTELTDVHKSFDGVADVQIFGERKYAMRIWLDPNRLAARGRASLLDRRLPGNRAGVRAQAG